MLERIIQASSNEDDVILDPFCGCATALVASEYLNRQWIGIDLSPRARDLIRERMEKELGMFSLRTIYREDVPRRTDLGKIPDYKTQKHTLFGQQEGICAGCLVSFPFRNLAIDHKIARAKGGTDHLENLQLLCPACNSKKGNQDPRGISGLTEGRRDKVEECKDEVRREVLCKSVDKRSAGLTAIPRRVRHIGGFRM